jgi:hypothetical protein
MPSSLPFISLFILGMFAQIYLSIDFFKNPKKNFLTILKSAALALVFPIISLFVVQKELRHLQYIVSLIMWCVFFCLCIMVFFKDEVVPKLNETSLLVINLLTLYLLIKNNLPVIFLGLYMFFSLATVLNAFIPLQPKRWQELALFVWYFILVVTIPIVHFNFVELYNNLLGKTVNFSVDSPFALGMTFSFVVIHLWFLFFFIPYRGKHESWESMLVRRQEMNNFYASKYEESFQLSPLVAVLVIASVVGLLAINYYFNFIPDTFIIILVLVVSSVLARQKTIVLASSNNL